MNTGPDPAFCTQLCSEFHHGPAGTAFLHRCAVNCCWLTRKAFHLPHSLSRRWTSSEVCKIKLLHPALVTGFLAANHQLQQSVMTFYLANKSRRNQGGLMLTGQAVTLQSGRRNPPTGNSWWLWDIAHSLALSSSDSLLHFMLSLDQSK